MLQKVILLGFVRAAVAGAAILATILATHAFSQADFGLISFSWSAATVCAYLLDGGLAIAVRKYGLSGVFIEAMGGSMKKRIAIRLGSLAVASTLSFFLIPFDQPILLVLVVALLGFGFAVEMVLADAYRHELKNVTADYLNGGPRNTLYLLFAAAALIVSMDAISLLFGVSGLLLILSSAKLGLLIRSEKRTHPTGMGLSASVSKSENGRFFGIGFFMMASAHLPVLLAGAVSGAEEAGLVRVALLFGTTMLFLNSALVLYFAPRIARVGADQVLSIQRQSVLVGRLVALIGLVLIFVLPFIVPAFFGPTYSSAVLGAQIIVGGVCFISLFGAYNQMLLMRGYEALPFHSALIAPMITILVPVVLNDDGNVALYCLGYASALVVGQVYTAVVGWRRFALAPWGARAE